MIRLADEMGPVLTSRVIAEELRMRVEQHVANGERVVVDFDGVEAISPSFGDELFAKLPDELVQSGQVRFENLTDDLMALLRFVVQSRSGG